MALHEWIDEDESAAEMLARVLTDRPFLLLPPLHRVPLRVGNVVELVGSSASSKTQILMQAIVKCILPKDWNGVHYGGLERAVMFIDLDCRFDILRLCQILRLRILEANGALGSISKTDGEKKPSVFSDDELHDLCMRRFLYNRCYDSFNFLSILKTLHYQLQKKKECGADVHVLMIDSIGAFHWIDRISSNRKSLSLHIVFEGIVREMKRLLLVHPMLVLVTKSTILGHKSTNLIKRNVSSSESSDLRNARNINQQPSPQEYMPLVWQSFVSHRVLLRASGWSGYSLRKFVSSGKTKFWREAMVPLVNRMKVGQSSCSRTNNEIESMKNQLNILTESMNSVSHFHLNEPKKGC